MTSETIAIPIITTARMILRAPQLSDFDTVATFYASGRSRWIGGPMPRDATWAGFSASAGQWVLRGYGQWCAQSRDTGRLLGRAGIYHPDNWPEPELSWALLDDASEGRGLAHEMVLAAREGAARLGVRRPISSIVADNARSIRLALRLGATAEGEWQTPFGPMLKFRHPEPA